MKERFIDFLKTNEIYDLFVYELINATVDSGSLFIDNINEYLEDVSPESYISHALAFNDSVYGYYFWSFYNGIWREIVDKENETTTRRVTKTVLANYASVGMRNVLDYISETYRIKDIKIEFK